MKHERFYYVVLSLMSAALVVTIGCFGIPLVSQDESNNSIETSDEASPGATQCRVDVVVEGMGEVDVECSADGRFATLTARPSDDFRFDRWIGSGSFSNVITVNNGSAITAVFVSTIEPPPGDVGDDDDTMITDNANENDNRDDDNDNDNIDDEVDNENENDNGANLLTVEVTGGSGSGMYDRGTLVTVMATVPQGRQFDRWIGNTEFIEVGTVMTSQIKVRVNGTVRLMAVFVNAPESARPPTLTISIPAPQAGSPGHRTVFGRDPIVVTIDAEIFEGTADRVVVFVDENNAYNPDDATQIYLPNSNTFSSVTTLDLEVNGLQKDRLFYVGATISDGLNPLVVKYATTRFRRSTLPRTFWMGSITPPTGAPQTTLPGLILEGVNVEDNAGTAFTGGRDITGDGLQDFLVLARYAKPQFINPTGVGVGEAYLVEGTQSRRTGRFNLNTVGKVQLPGVVITGINPAMFFGSDTEGLTDMLIGPDTDFDGLPELIFGVPNVDSLSAGQLCKEGQFLNGGVVIVSSKTSALDNTTSSARISLDDVGQRFIVETVRPEPEVGPLCADDEGNAYTVGSGGWFLDLQTWEEGDFDDVAGTAITCDGCVGDRINPMEDQIPDTWVQPNFGFSPVLAPPFNIHSCDGLFPPSDCPANDAEPAGPMDPPNAPSRKTCTYCPPIPGGTVHPMDCPDVQITQISNPHVISCPCRGTCATTCTAADVGETCGVGCAVSNLNFSIGSGFYPVSAAVGILNSARSPFGGRIIGKAPGDRFGTSIAISDGELIISAPARSGSSAETPSLLALPAANSGVAYIFGLSRFWENTPVKPHQTLVPSSALTMVGRQNQRIQNILGIADFNMDTRADIAVGAPLAVHPTTPGNGTIGDGAVFVAYRRGASLEGDYVLERLTFDPTSPNRLDGSLFVGRTDSLFGSSLASDVDFNGDGIVDLVVGAPNADGGIGEIYIIFGGTNVVTPINGRRVEDLLTLGQAVRITGDPTATGGQFGFNVVNAGDVDGDGNDDLLVAAPNMTPRFDANPFDLTDQFTTHGLDLDNTGTADNVTGPIGVPDFSGSTPTVNHHDELRNAGVVYLVLGSNNLANQPGGTISITELGKARLDGAIFVGRRGDRTSTPGADCTLGTNVCGDHLGGGDAGMDSMGGNAFKFDKGRSRGLGAVGDLDGDGMDDFAIGSILADVRLDVTGGSVKNAGEAYIIYGFKP